MLLTTVIFSFHSDPTGMANTYSTYIGLSWRLPYQNFMKIDIVKIAIPKLQTQ